MGCLREREREREREKRRDKRSTTVCLLAPKISEKAFGGREREREKVGGRERGRGKFRPGLRSPSARAAAAATAAAAAARPPSQASLLPQTTASAEAGILRDEPA